MMHWKLLSIHRSLKSHVFHDSKSDVKKREENVSDFSEVHLIDFRRM